MNKLKHLRWAIESRAKNQASSLKLLTLFDEHESTWKTQRFSRAAQDLLAVAFSLWRSAFLAEKTSKRANVFADGKKFLQKFIEDNTIGFSQDKDSREWTFNYYTRNARKSLEVLAQYWPNAVPMYQGRKRTAEQRWDYCQGLLDEAISNFGNLLREAKSNKERNQQIARTRAESRARRKKVRDMILKNRKEAPSVS